MSSVQVRPRVGVSVLVVDEQPEGVFVLLGKRKGSHAEGTYAAPGGHMEIGETAEETALRELKEECGGSLVTSRPRYLCTVNVTAYLPHHYVDVSMIARYCDGAPITAEPDKCEGWDWYSVDQLPSPLFAAVSGMITAYHTGMTYFPLA